MFTKPSFIVPGLVSVLILGGCVSQEQSISGTKPIILIAAFGSSYESGLGNLNDFDRAVARAFPDHEVRWAFTATFIVKKLQKNGVHTVFDRNVKVESLEQALQRIKEEGKTRVLIQSLHLMVGAEFREVLEADTSGLNVKFCYPLLFHGENIDKVVQALENEIADSGETATLFCAHGNEAHPEYNAELVRIDNYLRATYKNTYLAVMEGNPEFDRVKETVMNNGTKKVKFVTFMLTYGDHMSNDVMGDEEDSMKSQLGLPAECSNGLASHPEIQELFIGRMKSTLNQF
jgi:sirohydrochlorin cobaltochelatase